MTEKELWVAVRKNEREFFDIRTLSYFQDFTKHKACETDIDIPHWAKANPVVRYARVELKELEENEA